MWAPVTLIASIAFFGHQDLVTWTSMFLVDWYMHLVAGKTLALLGAHQGMF